MPDNQLLKKLRIKPKQKIAIINPPFGYLETLGNLPDGVEMDSYLSGSYDLIHAFFTQSQELENKIKDIKMALVKDGILWISYPKLSSKKESNLSQDILRESLAGKGLKAVSQISIDDT